MNEAARQPLPAPSSDERDERLESGPPSVGRTLRSFGFAVAGISYLVRTQPNFRVHLLATVAVIGVALLVGASNVETAVLLLAIGLVLVGEACNSALEAVVDLASPAIHPLAKIAKDVAAGGVLLAAIVAAATGLIVLGPKLAVYLRLTTP
jgi:diacylglycerol kinase